MPHPPYPQDDTNCPDCGDPLPPRRLAGPGRYQTRCDSCQRVRVWRQKGRGNLDLTAYEITDEVRRLDRVAYLRAVRTDPCGYCGEPSFALDHIIPRNAGGPDHWTNFAGLCHSCNNRKQDFDLLTALTRRRLRVELLPILQELGAWSGTDPSRISTLDILRQG
jgi:5-methylcytosine-specific restriction endonuclease McrA